MSSEAEFYQALREWVQVFMSRTMREVHLYLKRKDVTMAQYATLQRLRNQAECGVGDVGNLLGISNAAASQLVDRLVQQGLVERTEATHDRRVKHLSLTAKGLALLDDSVVARMGWTEQLAATLGPEQRQAVSQALGLLVSAARELEQPVS